MLLAFIASAKDKTKNKQEKEDHFEKVSSLVEQQFRSRTSDFIYDEKLPGVLVCFRGKFSTMAFTFCMIIPCVPLP